MMMGGWELVVNAEVYCVGVEDSYFSAVCIRSPKGRERVEGFRRRAERCERTANVY